MSIRSMEVWVVNTSRVLKTPEQNNVQFWIRIYLKDFAIFTQPSITFLWLRVFLKVMLAVSVRGKKDIFI